MNLIYLTGDPEQLARVLIALRDHLGVTNIAYVTGRDQTGDQTICVELP